MAQSARFLQLRRNISALRIELLPHRFSRTGAYSNPERESTRALAFRVLAHAELEAYVEDRVRDLAVKAIADWRSSQRVTPVIAALIAFVGRDLGAIPETAVPPQPTQIASWPAKIDLTERIQLCVNAFIAVIDDNHGVKEKNLLRLLLPVGISIAALHPTLLADMNSFGARRGEAAHGSRVQQLIDPQQELRAVRSLLRHLVKIDAELNVLSR